MKPDPQISVIVPIYNVAEHVADCIASLRAQTHANMDVIMVDDGSTDASARLATDAAGGDRRFRLLQQDNGGLSAARNTGLDHASGALIAFVDGDDRVMPDYLAALWDAMRRENADWVACSVNYCWRDADGQWTGQFHSAIHGAPDLSAHPVARRYALDDWRKVVPHFPSAWNKLYRRDLIDGLRFDDGTWFEDHAFFLRTAARTDHLVHLPQPLYLQTTRRDGQITGTQSPRVFEMLRVLDQVKPVLTESARPGGPAAFSRLASRSLHERQKALAAPDMRDEFARQSRHWLSDHGIDYEVWPERESGAAFALELAGACPLSVVVPWDGRDGAALDLTLDALHPQAGLSHETVIAVPRQAQADLIERRLGEHPGRFRVVVGKGRNAALAQTGLTSARGTFVFFAEPGTRPDLQGLGEACDALQDDRADMAAIGLWQGESRTGNYLHPFADCRTLPNGDLADGVFAMRPDLALALRSEISARLFRTDFLRRQAPGFLSQANGHWAVWLATALQAEGVVHVARICATLPARPARAQSAAALLRGHDAMVRAMPDAVAARLSPGWQRRLFARALRQEVAALDGVGSPQKALRLAALAMGAQMRGFGKTRVDVAGFDPSVGPGLAKLLRPQSLVRGAALLPQPDMIADYSAEHALFAFRVDGPARVELRADFSMGDYANVTFFGQEDHRVAFHVSLRKAEGLIVCNDRRSDGVWYAERTLPFDFATNHVDLAIALSADRAQLIVDGHAVATFGTRSLFNKTGFAELGGIRRMGLQGPLTVIEMLPESRPDAFTLDSRLQLIAPGPAQGATLRLEHSDERLELSELHLGDDRQGMMATLPGRHWRDLAPDQPLELTLVRPDGGSERLFVTRTDMAVRIAEILRHPPNVGDSILVPLIIEHLHHGEVFALLPAQAQEAARTLARAYDLDDYLGEDGASPGGGSTALLVPRPDRTGTEVEQVVARIVHSQSLSTPASALDVLRNMGLSRDTRRAAMLSLTDLFCRADKGDAFEDLYRYAQKCGDAEHLLPGANNWSRTACLPFLLRSGQTDTFIAAFAGFAEDPTSDWALTAPVAWVLHRLNDRAIGADQRERLIGSVESLLERLKWSEWPRAQCAELARACAALASDQTYGLRLRAAILGVFGLNQAFWDGLAGKPDLDAQLSALKTAFDALRDGLRARNDVGPALDTFAALGCIEAPRIQRALLRPVSACDDTKEDSTGRPLFALEEEALRRIALPGSETPGDAVSDLAAAALPMLYPEVEHAPLFDRQCDATRACRAILDDPRRLDNRETRDRLMEILHQLADARSGFLGLGLGAALVAALAGHPDNAPRVERLAAWCMSVLDELPAEEQVKAASSPALRGALMRMRADGSAVGWPLLSRLSGLGPPLPDVPPAGGPGDAAKTLFDAIVVVFSCRPYLDTRIPAMRDGCLSLLDEMGIPYIVVVGDGDGARSGDVVYLDAPDDYEGLPRKTLAALRWVHDHTDAAHMIKLDDDCFLDAARFFEPLSYRKFHYYGRTLWREAGQMDRRWHQTKASSQRGRHELDRSFEPSSYCDGGSAYALSRDAIARALDAARSPEGKRLLQGAFMEDKMLGDLLALRGIHPSNEDYRISILRRSHAKGRAVSSWLNGFSPSRTAPVPLIHLDGHEAQAETLARRTRKGLWPKKIWPTTSPVRLGYQTNALDLVSSEAQLARLRDAPVSVVASMRNEMFMLPHFLAHYRALGVQSFLIADNVSDDGTLEFLEAQPDVAVFSVDTDYNLSDYGVAWQQALLAHFRQGRWSLVADADELLVWSAGTAQSLPDLLASEAFAGADAVRLFMLDMYPEGPLEEADFAAGPFADAAFADRVPFLQNTAMRGPFSDQPAWTSALRHRLIPQARANLFVAQKIALMRYHPLMRLSAGLHFVSGVRLARQEMFLAHFKYNSDFRRKALAEVERRQHFNDAEEYARYLALVSEGQSVIHHPDLSARWSDVPFVAQRLIG